jgi:bacterioferritin
MELEGNSEVVRLLNGLLTTELRAINQYFLDSKMAGHWGLEGLEKEFRDASFEEMRDAEHLMDRILLLGGLPNLQRTEAFSVGETVSEQFELAVSLETKAVEQLHEAISAADGTGDQGTSLMLRGMLLGEEGQLDWAETELALIGRVGEANYLSQKMRG